MCAASAFSSVVFPVPVPPEIEDVLLRSDRADESVRDLGRQRTELRPARASV